MTGYLGRVRDLETRMMNAWPAIDTQIVDAWIVRMANGYSRRANSASALTERARLDASTLAHMEALFDAAHLTPVVRITPLVDDGVEPQLAQRGWREAGASVVMTAPLDVIEGPDASATLEPRPTDDWIAGNASSYGGEKANAAHLKDIVSRIRPAAVFATLSEGSEPAAWGICVTERGFAALQDLVVRPDLRGRGLGRRLTKTLMAAGRRAGASHAYLQVNESNGTARRLYESLGFVTSYGYTHRVRG